MFVVISPPCFGKIYWPSSRGHIERCFNVQLSHIVTTVVVFTVIKIIAVGLYVKCDWSIIRLQLRTV